MIPNCLCQSNTLGPPNCSPYPCGHVQRHCAQLSKKWGRRTPPTWLPSREVFRCFRQRANFLKLNQFEVCEKSTLRLKLRVFCPCRDPGGRKDPDGPSYRTIWHYRLSARDLRCRALRAQHNKFWHRLHRVRHAVRECLLGVHAERRWREGGGDPSCGRC